MKICLVGNSNSIHMQRWSRWFFEHGHDVHLITNGTTEIKGITIHYIKKTKGLINYFLRIIRTIKIIRGLKPQVVNAHFASSTETFAAALSNYHPLIVSTWGSDIAIDPEKSLIFKIEVKYVLKKADIVHTGDEFGKARLIQLGCNKHKIFIMPWGADLNLFNLNIEPFEKISKYVVLCVSPWYPNRNPFILLNAIPYVINKIKDIKFIFIGEGPEEQNLKSMAKKLDIEDYVVFAGKIPHKEMPKYFSISDILVDTDVIKDNAGAGIGVTNIEAMACGVPILLSEREYLIKAGKSLRDEPWYCSLVYEPGDPKDLSKKIIMLINDKALRKKISDREVKIAHEIGDWNKNMEKMEQIMLNLR
jgi:glycosyltransferase involved in cell wall biosynthesis